MATPRYVARELSKTARTIARIGNDTVTEAAAQGVELAIDAGGRFGRRPLTGDVVDVSNRKGVSRATLIGRSAGGWAIKSHGRRGGYPIRPRAGRGTRRVLDLRYAGTTRTAAASATGSATYGDNRWNNRVADPMRDRYADIARAELSEALRRGR